MRSPRVFAAAVAAALLGSVPLSIANAVTGLSVVEAEDLTYMREEEKLARDVYLTMQGYWDNRVFVNIAESEQSHADAVGALMDKYGLIDPTIDAIGYFTNSDLQALHDQLVTLGTVSELEALKVGGLIEEVDMKDIKSAIDRADHGDITRVYESLLCGSRNHLRSYVDSIERLGIDYEAQRLTQEEVDEIVESPMENCGRSSR